MFSSDVAPYLKYCLEFVDRPILLKLLLLEITSISYEQDTNEKCTVVTGSNPKEGLREIGFLSCFSPEDGDRINFRNVMGLMKSKMYKVQNNMWDLRFSEWWIRRVLSSKYNTV
jgi:hypothetical protein